MTHSKYLTPERGEASSPRFMSAALKRRRRELDSCFCSTEVLPGSLYRQAMVCRAAIATATAATSAARATSRHSHHSALFDHRASQTFGARKILLIFLQQAPWFAAYRPFLRDPRGSLLDEVKLPKPYRS